MPTRSLSSLQGWDKNPRGIKDDDYQRLKSQIQELGLYKPFIITEDGTVLGGNMRLKVCRELGIEEVPVSVVDAPTEERKLEYALSDNDRAGYYLEDKLIELALSMPDLDLGDYSIDLGEPVSIESLLEGEQEIEEDEAPPVPEGEPESKLGEVYQLGRHRLMCGDATKIEDVEKLMDGKKADMVFTDPPYNVNYTGNGHNQREGIMNDSMTDGDFYQFLLDAFSNLNVVMKAGATIYVCHAEIERLNFSKSFIDSGFLLKQCIIWNKNAMVMGRQDYQWKHEPILYGWKDGGSHTFYGGRDKTTVWNIDRPTQSKEHPTMKPIALIAEALHNSSKGDDIILDTFGGSGSTLIAAEQTNRTCYMMELDPKYCDVIRQRYQNYITTKKQ